MNDVTTGFGKSLLRIQTRDCFSTDLAPNVETLSRRTRIGDWNLPFIREIDLELSCFGGFYLGDFSACPQLEDMKLLIRGRLLTLPDPTDTSVKHGYLSPVWKLPRLRNLQVYKEASVMFNFASLDHMPHLEHLIMTSNYDYFESRILMPSLSSYFHVDASIDPEGGQEQKLKDHPDLPRLKTLRLHGPLNAVFCFNWLKGCQSLEELELGSSYHDYRRIPLSSLSRNSTIMPSTPPMDLPLGSMVDDVDDSGFDQEMAPLVASKLRKISIRGAIVMSEYDLIKVLTVYVPNLQSLGIPNIYEIFASDLQEWWPMRFLRFVMDSCSLLDVQCEYYLQPKYLASIGLSILYDEVEQTRESGQQVVSVSGEYYGRIVNIEDGR